MKKFISDQNENHLFPIIAFIIVSITLVLTALICDQEKQKNVNLQQLLKIQKDSVNQLVSSINDIEYELNSFQKTNKELTLIYKTLGKVYPRLSHWEKKYYSPIYLDFSIKYDIPWQSFPAIQYIENRFKPVGTSPKGAKGMLQLLDKTHQVQCKKNGIKWVPSQTPWHDLHSMINGFDYFATAFKKDIRVLKHVDSTMARLENGSKTYVGGPRYKNNNPYVKEYYDSFMYQFLRLSYFYRMELKTLDF